MTVKELEARMEDYESKVANLEETMEKNFERMQKAIENLTAVIEANNKGLKLFKDNDDRSEHNNINPTISERAKIPFPSFDGSNYRDWKAKAEQFFELESTPVDQRSCLLLLSMDGKAFSWQRNYMQQETFKDKSWQ